ncbi:AzlC family ABC transporter permease [Leeia sp. TBRC 13508]|uniref:AzlC family ABC transporter permease n=1 Tax=Leeia speluncae TaxID=2884804 RepID=A0ABS8DA90_9NEIS|nr:AzlC family ABC transporter permease [Leeia speluncae]MCB6185129.1 AzlC family ABC transporter permease [Leeia speluncae]
MSTAFRQSFVESAKQYLPITIGQLPWAIAAGSVLKSVGLSFWECVGMTVIVYSGTAQLGTITLIMAGTSQWLIALAACAFSIRFLLFSALIAPAFENSSKKMRLFASYILIDGVIAIYSNTILSEKDKAKRYGVYLGPSLLNVVTWLAGTTAGVLFADQIPEKYHFEFMATIVLSVLLAPAFRQLKSLIVCLVSGLTACLFINLPMRTGFFVAILAGIFTGALLERLQKKTS